MGTVDEHQLQQMGYSVKQIENIISMASIYGVNAVRLGHQVYVYNVDDLGELERAAKEMAERIQDIERQYNNQV